MSASISKSRGPTSSPFMDAPPKPAGSCPRSTCRRSASLANDSKTINDALGVGYFKLAGNRLVADMFEFYWQPPAPVYDPAKAKQLLAEAGDPNGFDAGAYYCDSSYANLGEAVLNNRVLVGIRVKLRPIERAAFIKGYAEKTYKNILKGGSGNLGNAPTP